MVKSSLEFEVGQEVVITAGMYKDDDGDSWLFVCSNYPACMKTFSLRNSSRASTEFYKEGYQGKVFIVDSIDMVGGRGEYTVREKLTEKVRADILNLRDSILKTNKDGYFRYEEAKAMSDDEWVELCRGHYHVLEHCLTAVN